MIGSKNNLYIFLPSLLLRFLPFSMAEQQVGATRRSYLSMSHTKLPRTTAKKYGAPFVSLEPWTLIVVRRFVEISFRYQER